MNELKSMLVADPIIILGGSPINVDAPPTLEDRTIASMKGTGDTLNVLNTEIVTGTISRTVVTLSINIEVIAVKVHKIIISFHKFPLHILLALIPTY
jgi:hypothetical protein